MSTPEERFEAALAHLDATVDRLKEQADQQPEVIEKAVHKAMQAPEAQKAIKDAVTLPSPETTATAEKPPAEEDANLDESDVAALRSTAEQAEQQIDEKLAGLSPDSEVFYLHGKPLADRKLEVLGYMIEEAQHRPDEIMPGATRTHAELLSDFREILAFLNTQPSDIPDIRNYAEPGAGFAMPDSGQTDLELIKEYVADARQAWEDTGAERVEQEKFRFDFINPWSNAVNAEDVAVRLVAPPPERIFPLWEWTPELRVWADRLVAFAEPDFPHWESFRTGTWKGRPNSSIRLPQLMWLLPDFDWQDWIEKVAALPLRENPEDYGPPGSKWRGPIATGYTINCQRGYGDDCLLPSAREQTPDCNQYASEFEYRGRRIVKSGNERWNIMCTHPIAACLFTINSNPVLEWGFGIGGISTSETPDGSMWNDYDWAGSPGGTNAGDKDRGGWGWFGKEQPESDFDLLMWRIHPERQPNYPDGLKETMMTFPGGDPSTMTDYFSTPSVFGCIASLYPQPLGFCEALEVCVRRVEQVEWAYGVGDKPDWIDWIDLD